MISKVNRGKEYGPNLIKLVKKLLKNQNLCKLLVNTDLEPLNPDLHPDIEDTMSIYRKNIRVVPLVTSDEETTASKVILVYGGAEPSDDNSDNEEINLLIYVYVPYKEWEIAGDQLRPFAIMAEIRESIQDRKINGLGEVKYRGFTINSLTNQMGSYLMRFSINAFN